MALFSRYVSYFPCCGSLYRVTGLLSRIQYGNREIFSYIPFSVVLQFLGKKKTPDFFRTKFIWVRAGSGLGFGFGLGLGLVSKVVIWAFFDISLVITLEPHVDHTIFPVFHTLS